MPEGVSPTIETPQPTQSTKSKSTGWTKIILAAILGLGLLAAAVYAGYWYGTEGAKLKTQSSKPQLKTQSQVTPTPEPTPAVTDPTADWNTYRSENVAFTFKYPRDITIWGREENIIRLSLWGPTQKSDTEFYDGLSLTFSLPKTPGEKSLRELVEISHSEQKAGEFIEEVGDIEETVLSGLDGFKFSLKYIGNHTIKYIYLQSNDQPITYVQIVDATNDPTDRGFDEIANQILSTFRFLD